MSDFFGFHQSEETNESASSRLAWLLQDRRVSDLEVAQALAEAFGVMLMEQFGEQAARRALVRAVAERQRYDANTLLDQWLKALAAQERWDHQPIWKTGPPEEMAEAIITKLLEASKIVEQATGMRRQRWLRMRLVEGVLAAVMLLAVFWLGRSSNDWMGNTETPAPPTPTAAPAEMLYYYRAQEGETIEAIADRAGVAAETLQSLNLLSQGQPLQDGQVLALPAATRLTWPTPAAVQGAPLATPPSPLENPSIEQVLERMRLSSSLWRSLWVNALVIQYGAPGYIGPPVAVTRKQAWIIQTANQMDWLRVITGPLGGKPEETYVNAGAHTRGQNLLNNQSFEYLQSDGAWQHNLDFDLRQLIDLSSLLANRGTFTLTSSENQPERIAGRPTWRLDWGSPNGQRIYTLWVDAVYGIVLQRREYDASGQIALADLSVQQIEYDWMQTGQNSQAAGYRVVFNPFEYPATTFAQGPDGLPDTSVETFYVDWTRVPGRTPLERTPVPANHNLASSRLSFVRQPQGVLDVFADGYFLGQLPLPASESILACRRSPDGKQIAFQTLNTTQGVGNANVYWVDLGEGGSTLQMVTVATGSSSPGGLAFGPSTKDYPLGLLVYFACPGDAPASHLTCGAHLFNPQEVQSRLLLPASYADYFRWKPDGSALGLHANNLGLDDNKIGAAYQIIEIGSGEIIYSGSFDWSRLAPAANAPMKDWGDPPQMPGGLEGCTEGR